MFDGKLILKTFRAGFGSGGDCLSTHNFVVRAVDQLLILGMVIPPVIEHPYKGYIKPQDTNGSRGLVPSANICL